MENKVTRKTNRGFVIATSVLAITYSLGLLAMLKNKRIEKEFAYLALAITLVSTFIMVIFYFKDKDNINPQQLFNEDMTKRLVKKILDDDIEDKKNNNRNEGIKDE